jgi:hypothetical protein
MWPWRPEATVTTLPGGISLRRIGSASLVAALTRCPPLSEKPKGPSAPTSHRHRRTIPRPAAPPSLLLALIDLSHPSVSQEPASSGCNQAGVLEYLQMLAGRLARRSTRSMSGHLGHPLLLTYLAAARGKWRRSSSTSSRNAHASMWSLTRPMASKTNALSSVRRATIPGAGALYSSRSLPGWHESHECRPIQPPRPASIGFA